MLPTFNADRCSKNVKIRTDRQTEYHDAAGQIVEDGSLQNKSLSPDDGVRQAELQEEGLEDFELLGRSKTEAA